MILVGLIEQVINEVEVDDEVKVKVAIICFIINL